jgi:ATP-dependent RNA helicase DeaD
MGDTVWFRINIGHARNAEPRWLIPLICKAGGITKAEIGSIRIFDRDTRFQIKSTNAEAFADAVKGKNEDNTIITPAFENSRAGSEPAVEPDATKAHKKGPFKHKSKDGVAEAHPAASPYKPAGDRPFKPSSDRPFKAAGDKPYKSGDKPFKSGSAAPFKAGGGKPFKKKFKPA